MKKLIFLFAVLFFSCAAFAQQDETKSQAKTGHHQQKEYIAMENGQMVVMMGGGQSRPLTADTTVGNGTMVMSDGTVKMKDGKTRKLKDNECVYMDGKIGTMKKKSGM